MITYRQLFISIVIGGSIFSRVDANIMEYDHKKTFRMEGPKSIADPKHPKPYVRVTGASTGRQEARGRIDDEDGYEIGRPNPLVLVGSPEDETSVSKVQTSAAEKALLEAFVISASAQTTHVDVNAEEVDL